MTGTRTVEPARTVADWGVEVGRRGVEVGLLDARRSGVEVGFGGVEIGFRIGVHRLAIG